MEIDGTAVPGNKNYGLYFARVNVIAGQTNELPYFIWMTELDQAHTVTIASPTTRETVVSTPLLKGLELHLSPNTVITDYDGKVVYQLNITEIPVSRPPFPLPNVVVAFFFTIQPGGAYGQHFGTISFGGQGLSTAPLLFLGVDNGAPVVGFSGFSE